MAVFLGTVLPIELKIRTIYQMSTRFGWEGHWWYTLSKIKVRLYGVVLYWG